MADTLRMIKELELFNFTDREARVYLALLELGPSVVSVIAKSSGLKRSSLYILLDSLNKKGFVSTSESEHTGTRTYIATSPERIIYMANENLKKSQQLIQTAEKIFPALHQKYTKSDFKPRVRFLDGKEGIINAYEDTLTSSETIRSYASIDHMHSALPEYFPEYYHRRAAKGIHINVIMPDTDAAKNRAVNNKKEARHAYLIPQTSHSFNYEINLYDNKVVMMSLVDMFAIIIESEGLSEALKRMFDLSREEAKRLHEEKYGDKFL